MKSNKKELNQIKIIKSYNKKISKTKSKLTYVPIDINSFKGLNFGERENILRIIKKFDLRKEIKLKDSNISKNTRDLLVTLQRYSNKRIEDNNLKYNVTTKKLGGEIIEEQKHLQTDKLNTSDINFKNLNKEALLRTTKRFEKHYNPNYFNTRLLQMRENYLNAITLHLMFFMSDNDVRNMEAGVNYTTSAEKLIEHIQNMPIEKWYRLYLENIDAATPFSDSPSDRKKHEIEMPQTPDDILFENLSRIFEFDEK